MKFVNHINMIFKINENYVNLWSHIMDNM